MPKYKAPTRCRRGFTLIELMVTLAVAAILMMVAVPAFDNIIESNTITVARNKLIGALSFARSAAVSRGQAVALCKSADGHSCASHGDWSQGWIVYTSQPGPDKTPIADRQLLRVESGLNPQITVTGDDHTSNGIQYDPLGFTIGENGHWTISHAGSTDEVVVVISNVGRVRIE